jgi:hypothetical protein
LDRDVRCARQPDHSPPWQVSAVVLAIIVGRNTWQLNLIAAEPP